MLRAIAIRSALLSLAVGQACAPADEADQAAESEDATFLAARASPCSAQELISPEVLNTTERVGFSGDGRLFVIGTRPNGQLVPPSFLLEIKKTDKGFAAENILTGTLEGTVDGELDGAARGDACIFSGMAVRDNLLYAGCFAFDGRASLYRVDLEKESVRVGYFDSCRFETKTSKCEKLTIYPNGMTIDDRGRLYASDTGAFGLNGGGALPYSIYQIDVAADQPSEQASAGLLAFTFRGWTEKNVAVDGLGPNGLQYRDGVVYYAAGANLQAIPVRSDGSAGRMRTYFRGSALSYIDDFAVGDGEILLGRTLPGEIARIVTSGSRAPRQDSTCPMLLTPPSGFAYQPDLGAEQSLLEPGSVIFTRFFGGGLYALPGWK